MCCLQIWQIFVGNDIDTPLPYAGHLDAQGIAAHLAMRERVSKQDVIYPLPCRTVFYSTRQTVRRKYR